MNIDYADDLANYSDLLAVCGFSFIGLLLSVRMLFLDFGPLGEITSLL
jgi:hypothetical protein